MGRRQWVAQGRISVVTRQLSESGSTPQMPSKLNFKNVVIVMFGCNCTVYFSVEDVVADISTETLTKELERRAVRKVHNPNDEEAYDLLRYGIGDRMPLEFGMDDYHLVDKDDVNDIESCSDEALIDECADRGLLFVPKPEPNGVVYSVHEILDRRSPAVRLDFICDILRISRRSTFEEICLELKNYV